MTDRSERKLPTTEEIQDALSSVLESSVFARSERARELLDYIVTQEQEGRGSLLKGFSIAQDVFGKDDDFDPSTDAVVRVQAGRLREILNAYYEAEGAADPVKISVPRGTYVPTYAYNDAPAGKNGLSPKAIASLSGVVPPKEGLDFGKPTTKLNLKDDKLPSNEVSSAPGSVDFGSVQVPAKSDPMIEKTVKRLSVALVGLFLLLGTILLLLLFNRSSEPVSDASTLATPKVASIIESLPSITVKMGQVGNEDWLHLIRNAVFRFSAVRLVDGSAAAGEPDLRLEVQPRDETSADVSLVHIMDDVVVWSGNISLDEDRDPASSFSMRGAMTNMFTPGGKLYSHLAEHNELSGLAECLYLTNAYFVAQNPERYVESYDCHNTLLSAGFKSPLIYADVASLMVERLSDKYSYPENVTQQSAFSMARKGLEDGVLPETYRALSYYFSYSDQVFAAESAIQSAYRLNPFNLEFAAAYAYALERSSAYDDSQEIMASAVEEAITSPSWWAYSLFISSYVNNDMQTATLAARKLANSNRSHYIAARLIVETYNENEAARVRLLEELNNKDTAFTRDPWGFYMRLYPPGIAARFTQALKATGYNWT